MTENDHIISALLTEVIIIIIIIIIPVDELAATKKDKYSGLAADYLFQPIAVEILGPINESASDFLSLLPKKINQHFGDERETAFLLQRVSATTIKLNKQCIVNQIKFSLRS